MKNTLRNTNFGFTKWYVGMALLRSEPRKLNRSFGGLRASLLLVLTAGWIGAAQAAVLVDHNFSSFNTGDLVGQQGWTQIGSAASPNLTISGGVVNLSASGQDAGVGFTSVNSGSLYLGFKMRVTSSTTGGDYFGSFNTSANGTTYTGRIFIKRGATTSKFVFGLQIGVTGATPVYGTTELDINTDYVIISKYNFVAGSANDTGVLYVNPVNLTTEGSNTPYVNTVTWSGTSTESSALAAASIRQGGATTGAAGTIARLLVSNDWASVAALAAPASGPSIATTGTLNSFSATAGTASAAQTFTVTGANLSANVTVTAPTGFEVASDGATFGNTATINQSGGSASGTVSVRVAASAPAGAISGNVTLASTTASGSVAVSGFVSGPVALPYGPEGFDVSQGQWLSYSSSSTKNWSRVLLGTDYVMQINGYDATIGAPIANDWLILGPINVPSGISSLVANFNIQKAFTSGADSEFNLKVSSNYSGSGDPTSATWGTVNFTKPAAQASGSTIMDASGNVVLPSSLHGQSAVYVAFHLEAASATGTSRWSIDDFALTTTTVPPLSFTGMPASIDEGVEVTIGTISIPSVLSTDLNVIVTSSLPSALTVNGGNGASGSTTVTIPAGDTSSTFFISTIRDFEATADRNATLTASADGYQTTTSLVTIKNLDLASTSLGASGYTQTFTGYAAATPTLPLGWSATGATTTFPATANAWNEGTSGGFRGGASVLGYQHSSSTGTLVKTLTLKNETGATITDLTVSYKGRVARASEGRTPSYAVTVGGQAVPALAYSTADGDNTARTASLTGLSIANGTSFQISWSSDGSDSGSPGSGSRRQIGISEVSVTLGATSIAPSLSGLSIPIINVTRTQAKAEANVTADGGAVLTKRGFVIAATSANPNPEIGGTGVTNVEDAGTEVGLMTATFTGLSVGTGYTVKAYAINSVGTSYTAAQSFTTVGAALSFTGTYSESFDSYTGTAPAGWHAVSSTGVQGYGGEWGSGSSGGFRGTGATTGGVLGYQPTLTTGDLTVTLSLINNTGATIETLNIGYLGRAARVDQARISSWAVAFDGQAVADLAYSTDNTSGEVGAPGDETKTTQLTGLSIANGTEFTLTWTSPNPTGSGSSRQIGLADVVVSTSAPTPAAPSNLSYMPATVSGTVGTAISSLTPTVTGTVDTYSVSPTLPSGLSINASSGVISGTPTAIAASATYTVTAANVGGNTTATVTVVVAKGTPSITAVPLASAITEGEAFSASVLSGGTASVAGAFAWTTPSAVPTVGTASYEVTFTPTDTANYSTAVTTVSLTVNSAGTTYSGWLGQASASDAAFLDYVFGAATPGTLDPSLKPTVAVTGGKLVLTFYVREETVGLTVTPKASADLAAGPSGWVTTDVTVADVGAAREVNGVMVQQKTASVPVSGTKKFLRVEAVQQ